MSSSPRAVILAGGYGTRMMPLTQRRPKHLLPIGDEPVIAAQLRGLARAGVVDVVLATSYHADAFAPVLADGSRYGVRLSYAREETPLGTGGALRNALVALDGPDFAKVDRPVVVLNGDLVTEHDIAAQVQAHEQARAGITLHVRYVEDARAYGLVTLDAGRVVEFREKPHDPVPGLVNAGTYVVDPAMVRSGPADAVVSLERDVFPQAASAGLVHAYRQDAHFADIGSPQALLAANMRWAEQHRARAVTFGADIHPTATVRDSVVLPGACIEAGAIVLDSVLGPGAVIGAGAKLRGCVLGDDATVPAGRVLTDVVLDVGEHAATI